MPIEEFSNCPICGVKLCEEIRFGMDYIYYIDCSVCGKFSIDNEYYDAAINSETAIVSKSQIASYLYYQMNKLPFPFLCDEGRNPPRNHRRVSLEEIDIWYPKTFSEKIDRFLLGLAERMNFLGEPILFTEEKLYSACFVNRNPAGAFRKTDETIPAQEFYFENYMIEQGLITPALNGFVIEPKGLERIDSLQKTKNLTKDVFVSMAFNNGTSKTRETIRNAIVDAAFSPEFIDEIIHNKQIVPEMFRLIRECRFLILEISEPNYGAYYEAGYALGLGKEVIICCSKEAFNRKYETEEEQKYAKYLRPHFDIAQKQILVWDDYEDLRKKLAEWIKALF